MRLKRRVAWLTALAIVVGGVSGLAGIVNFFTAKARLQDGPIFYDPPDPSIAAIMGKYWWAWIGTMLAWLSVVYLAHRMTREPASQATPYPSRLSPMKTIVGAEFVATAGTVSGLLLIGVLAGWS